MAAVLLTFRFSGMVLIRSFTKILIHLILALRTAGFAAWLRDFDQLYPGSPIHIHAIAIGDRDLSPAAQSQLNANYGYFNGNNGIPPENGAAPVPDEFGGPILCEWMTALGYKTSNHLQP